MVFLGEKSLYGQMKSKVASDERYLAISGTPRFRGRDLSTLSDAPMQGKNFLK